MKQIVIVTKKLKGRTTERFYTSLQKDIEHIYVTIAPEPEIVSGKEGVGVVDRSEEKIIFEFPLEENDGEYEFLDRIKAVDNIISATLSADKEFFLSKENEMRPIEVYFVNSKGFSIGSYTFGTPYGRTDSYKFEVVGEGDTVNPPVVPPITDDNDEECGNVVKPTASIKRLK